MRRHSFAVATAAVTLALSGVAASPAHAATCYGGACNGKNPSTAGCTNISSVRTADSADGLKHLELRYSSSASCDAYWARARYDDVYWSGTYLIFSVERRYDYNGITNYYSSDVDESESGFTMMFGRAKGFSYRACMREKWSGGNDVFTKCTSWVAG
ncbi:MAG: hypothetical protein U0Q15_00810 [Kineosporiaceae bacterium]